MSRRRRGTDIERIIGAVVALVALVVGYGVLTGGSASKAIGTSAPGPFAALIGLAWILISIALIVAAACGVIFLVWKVASTRTSAPSKAIQNDEWDPPLDEEQKSPDMGSCLDKLDWFQLEKLVAVLFEQSNYRVESRGGAHPDGGIDLVVETEGNRIAIQCKKWATWKCGVAVVRELMGSMVHEGIGQGYLVAREVTNEARELAEKHAIGIIDREKLVTWIEDLKATGNQSVLSALENPEKRCPKCGAGMVLRTASKGRGAGTEFWGCSTFPRCRGIIR